MPANRGAEHPTPDAVAREQMRAYAQSPRCRRQVLLSYFAEPFDPPCGACDNCHAGRALEIEAEGPVTVGARVVHQTLGGGTVAGWEEGRLTVGFDESGYRTILGDEALATGRLIPENENPGPDRAA